MTVHTPMPAPDPDEVERGIAELERHLARTAPTDDRREQAAPQVPGGETRRVRRLQAEVAEAHQLAALQADDTPLLLDTPRVRRRRRRAYEAARLHELSQDPVMRAWQAARMRRVLTATALVSLTLALAWSTAGVQHFAADGAEAWTPMWLFAWLVEPFLSLGLLTIVGAKAYLGSRGQPIRSATLTRLEWLFLALTLSMNAWPYLPGVADRFSLSRLVLHLLGPVVAVAIVTALPIILAAFADLDHHAPGRKATGPKYSENTPSAGPVGKGAGRPIGGSQTADLNGLIDTVRRKIRGGELPREPSAHAIRRALGCGTDTARQIRDALRETGP